MQLIGLAICIFIVIFFISILQKYDFDLNLIFKTICLYIVLIPCMQYEIIVLPPIFSYPEVPFFTRKLHGATIVNQHFVTASNRHDVTGPRKKKPHKGHQKGHRVKLPQTFAWIGLISCTVDLSNRWYHITSSVLFHGQ